MAITSVEANRDEPIGGGPLHASVYDELRRRLITGKITPGVGLSTRGLALELGVSQMPVRDALCRLLLEPEAAVAALPLLDAQAIGRLRRIDADLDRAIEDGDVIAYMECNHAFHFGLYRANGRATLNRLIETLWLQFGPFMSTVYSFYGATQLVDQHRLALEAMEAG